MNRNGRKHAARDILLLIGILGVAVLLSMALSGTTISSLPTAIFASFMAVLPC